jgi:uncharacterized protein with beta-barrel porin domain
VLKRKVLLLGAVSAAVVGQALADDRSITTQVTTPVTTQNANNGPGNISITSTGSVVVSGTDAAATVNSPHTLTNDGVITNSAASNALGVRLQAGTGGGAYVASGAINVNGTGSNNIGLKVDGTGAFAGAITMNSGSTINFQGTDSIGMLIASPFTGNVSLAASIVGIGQNTRGVVVVQPITGSFSNLGTILVNGTQVYNSLNLDPQSGAALSIGGSITGGLLNDGPQSATDTVTAANLNAIGSNPALLISPTVAGSSAADITIGILTAANTPGDFSFINRGNIITDGNDPGISAVAARIEGSATTTTSLPGGLYNRGTIRSAATTQNLTASSQPAAEANSTGLAIGDRATVERLVNEGTLFAAISGTKGGTTAAIDIAQGGTLRSVTNSSFITSSATTTDGSLTNLFAYGIRDRSGTLTSITNTGTIGATGTATATSNAFRAADLSANTTGVAFNNFGTVTGSVLFGSGANTLRIETTGSSAAMVAGRLTSAGSGTLDVNLVSGRLKTDASDVRNLTVAAGGVVEFALNRTTEASAARPLVKASGAVTFAQGATVVLTPTSFLPDRTEYVLLTASSLTLPSGLLQQQLPFLFQTAESGLKQSGNSITLQLRRKTAAELALTGNSAAIYDPAFAAAATDDSFGAALLTLGSQDEVQATLRSLLPNTTAGVRALTIAATDQATGPIGARQRALVTMPKQGLGFWAQQFYEDLNASTTADGPSYFASGLGVAVGAEWGALQTGRYGVGYSYFAGQATERHPRSSKADVGLHMVSVYGGWRWQDFYVTPQANLGIGSFTGNRLVRAGSFSRVVRGDWTGYLASGGATAGYVFNFGPIEIIPQVSLDGLYMRQTSYAERGGGSGIDLNVGTQDAKSVRLFAGVVAQSGFMFEGGRLQPQVLAGWSRDLMKDPSVIDASFEALPGSSFALVGPTSDPSRLIGGASFAYILDNWTAGVNYDAAQSSGAFAQSATVNITSRF